jgi:molecular chaperone DnaJ
MKGEGEAGTAGRGDLFLIVEMVSHPRFSREGDDLHTEVAVSFPRAALGGEVAVPTLDGVVMMKIPAGTQGGSTFRLKGKGMPRLRGSGRGDLMVKVNIEIPRTLGAEQRRLVEELEKSLGG